MNFDTCPGLRLIIIYSQRLPPNLNLSQGLSFLSYLAVIIAVGGQVVRLLALMTAGRNFTHIIQSKKDPEHTLVTTGIYQYNPPLRSPLPLLSSHSTHARSLHLQINQVHSTPRLLWMVLVEYSITGHHDESHMHRRLRLRCLDILQRPHRFTPPSPHNRSLSHPTTTHSPLFALCD